MSTVTDDEIIKRRLLIEGESGNDDRRITLLLKNYLRWVASDDVGEDGKYKKLKATLERLENLNEEYDRKIQLRKTQFHLFLVALKGLQKIVEDDDSLSSATDDLVHTQSSKSIHEEISMKMDTN
ncbi:unnamed protein product [Schistosoma margrebowiei]|uniref:Uncharacterized protein n=1 Tax=Schistosoma margrebowiei TaxID=48269 RepID=A0A183LME7_9TREM|nr:unnamed protein product [Schistosoma margrebowiei]